MDTFSIWMDGEYVGTVRAVDTERALRFFLGDVAILIHHPEDERIKCSWAEIGDTLIECAPAYQRNV